MAHSKCVLPLPGLPKARMFSFRPTNVPSKSEAHQKLNKSTIPTIVILGKLDFVIPYKAWEELINNKANIEYVLLENASHNPHTEESTQNEFDKHLIDWINRLN